MRKTSQYASDLNPASAIGEFQVVVPRSWDWGQCQALGRQSSYVRPVMEADILVGESHPQFGSHPWTLNSRGCGERGLLINLPISFLVSTSLDFDVRGGYCDLCEATGNQGKVAAEKCWIIPFHCCWAQTKPLRLL